jgi:hypothetical protein
VVPSLVSPGCYLDRRTCQLRYNTAKTCPGMPKETGSDGSIASCVPDLNSGVQLQIMITRCIFPAVSEPYLFYLAFLVQQASTAWRDLAAAASAPAAVMSANSESHHIECTYASVCLAARLKLYFDVLTRCAEDGKIIRETITVYCRLRPPIPEG